MKHSKEVQRMRNNIIGAGVVAAFFILLAIVFMILFVTKNFYLNTVPVTQPTTPYTGPTTPYMLPSTKIMVASSTVPTTQGPNQNRLISSSCQHLDMLFLIDESQSMQIGNGFEYATSFIIEAADAYKIIPDVRFAWIAFNSKIWVQTPFMNAEDFKTNVSGTHFNDGNTNFVLGFNAAVETISNYSVSTRASALIFFSDGFPNNGGDLNAISAITTTLRCQLRTVIIGLGINEGVEGANNMKQAIGVGATDGCLQSFYDDIVNYNNISTVGLQEIVHDLHCSGSEISPNHLDIIFLFENSELVDYAGRKLELGAMIQTINDYGHLNYSGDHVGIVFFSSRDGFNDGEFNKSGILNDPANNNSAWSTFSQAVALLENFESTYQLGGASDLLLGLNMTSVLLSRRRQVDKTRNIPAIIIMGRGTFLDGGNCCDSPVAFGQTLRVEYGAQMKGVLVGHLSDGNIMSSITGTPNIVPTQDYYDDGSAFNDGVALAPQIGAWLETVREVSSQTITPTSTITSSTTTTIATITTTTTTTTQTSRSSTSLSSSSISSSRSSTLLSSSSISSSRSSTSSSISTVSITSKSTIPDTTPLSTTDTATGIINRYLNAIAEQKFNTSAEAQKALGDVLNEIEFNTDHLNAESIYLISLILQNIANVPNISSEVFHLFLKIVDVLLDLKFEKFYESDIDQNSQGKMENSTSRIAKSFESLVQNSADATVSYLTGKNIAILAQTIYHNRPKANGLIDCGSEGFRDNSEHSNCETENPRVAVSITDDAIKTSNAIKLFFMIYRNRNLFDQRRFVPAEDADPCDNKKRLPSPLVATATLLYGSNNPPKIAHAVTIKYDVAATYKALNQSPPLHGAHYLTYWDWNTLNWAVNGCQSVSSSNNIFEGHCSHLTDFTIIFQGTKNDPILCDLRVKLTGHILSAASSIALFTLIAIFVASSLTPFKSFFLLCKLRGSPTRNQLVGLPYLTTLFCYFFIFTIFIDRNAIDLSDTHCNIVAAVLYTSLISVVLWTIVQGFEVIKRIFHFTRTAKVLKIATNIYLTSIICTGLPIALTVTLWLRTDEFFSRSDGFCWIRPDYVLFGVIFPTSSLVLFDILFTFIIVYKLFFVDSMGNDENSRRIQTLAAQKKERIQKVVLLASMQVILGAPWVLQYFTIGAPQLVLSHILFTVINGSQGLMLELIYLLITRKQDRRMTPRKQQKVNSASDAVRQRNDYTNFDVNNRESSIIRTRTATEILSDSPVESLSQLDDSEPSIHSKQRLLNGISDSNVFYKNPSISIIRL